MVPVMAVGTAAATLVEVFSHWRQAACLVTGN
jgi:hypothetical protein